MTIRRLKTLWAALLALGLAGIAPVFGESVVAGEHSDCIIEPMLVVEVGTSVAGVVDEMLVDRSDRVKSGQPLARLESSVEEVNVRRSQERAGMLSEIRARQADLELARHKMQRIKDLYARKVVSKQQHDEAINELERADQAVKIAREKLHLAKLDLEHAQAQLDRRLIRSPIKGVILERLAQAGEYVDERPLLSVAQLDPLRVEVLMPAQAFGSIEPGMVARVTPELAARAPLDARVVLVDPIIDTASGTFGVRLELPNADYAIPSGMRCRVSFVTDPAGQESIAAGAGESMDESGFLSSSVHPSTETGVSPVAADSEPGSSGPIEIANDLVESTSPEPPTMEPPALAVDSSDPLPSSSIAESQADLRDLAAPEPDPAEDAVEALAQCWRLGPWRDARARDAVAEHLGRSGVKLVATQDTEEQGRRWMVFVPGRGGLDTADQLTGLAKAGFEDLYVIRRGKQRGDVSVGLYDRQSHAQQRTRQLSEQGFPAQLIPQRRKLARSWLWVSGTTAQQLFETGGLPESKWELVACDESGVQPASGVLVGTRPVGQIISHLD